MNNDICRTSLNNYKSNIQFTRTMVYFSNTLYINIYIYIYIHISNIRINTTHEYITGELYYSTLRCDADISHWK